MKKIPITKTTHQNGAVSYSYPVDMSTVHNVQYAPDMSYAIGESDDPTLLNATQSEMDAVIMANSPVPKSVTKRQGRQQMILMGVIGMVQPAIDAIEDPIQRALVQSFWDDSSDYERGHPQMVELAAAIGITESQLDQAFVQASRL
jgi:isochorismate hydrolase